MDSHVDSLVLLFVFDKMEVPLSMNTVLDLCCYSNSWVNYMDCQNLMSGLLDAGFIYVVNPRANEKQYAITTNGRTCLANFYSHIPLSDRETIAKYIKNNCMQVKRRQDYVADYEQNENGNYTVSLRVVSSVDSSIEVKINVPTRDQAEKLRQKWAEKAAKTYEALYEILLSE